jgi:hypothetical protein
MHVIYEMFSFVVNVLAIAGVLVIVYCLLEALHDFIKFLTRNV